MANTFFTLAVALAWPTAFSSFRSGYSESEHGQRPDPAPRMAAPRRSTAAPIRSRITASMCWWWVPAAPACAPRSAAARPGSRPLHHQVFPTAPIRWRRRAEFQPRSAIWARTIGAGTCTTPSRARTGSATRTPSNSCAQRAGRGLRARALGGAVLAHRGRQDLPAPVRRHDHHYGKGTAHAPVRPPTVPGTPCCTRCMARRCGIRPSSSSSISSSI